MKNCKRERERMVLTQKMGEPAVAGGQMCDLGMRMGGMSKNCTRDEWRVQVMGCGGHPTESTRDEWRVWVSCVIGSFD